LTRALSRKVKPKREASKPSKVASAAHKGGPKTAVQEGGKNLSQIQSKADAKQKAEQQKKLEEAAIRPLDTCKEMLEKVKAQRRGVLRRRFFQIFDGVNEAQRGNEAEALRIFDELVGDPNSMEIRVMREQVSNYLVGGPYDHFFDPLKLRKLFLAKSDKEAQDEDPLQEFKSIGWYDRMIKALEKGTTRVWESAGERVVLDFLEKGKKRERLAKVAPSVLKGFRLSVEAEAPSALVESTGVLEEQSEVEREERTDKVTKREHVSAPSSQAARNAYAIELIQKLGLSQTDLGKLTGKSQPLINHIVNGNANATPSFIKQLEWLQGDKQSSMPRVRRQLFNELDTLPEVVQSELTHQFLNQVRLLKQKRSFKRLKPSVAHGLSD